MCIVCVCDLIIQYILLDILNGMFNLLVITGCYSAQKGDINNNQWQ